MMLQDHNGMKVPFGLPIAVPLLVHTVSTWHPCLFVQRKLQLDLVQPQGPRLKALTSQVHSNLPTRNAISGEAGGQVSHVNNVRLNCPVNNCTLLF